MRLRKSIVIRDMCIILVFQGVCVQRFSAAFSIGVFGKKDMEIYLSLVQLYSCYIPQLAFAFSDVQC